MKINCQLDYQTILGNTAQPVHLVVKLTADKFSVVRSQPIAFSIVLDRSGSMEGQPLDYAKKACELVVKNLRPEDYFSLVIFDDTAQVVVPLQQVSGKEAVLNAIRGLRSGGSTNLTAGWMLGRDELKKTPADCRRRLLLLSDGQLNVGIIDPTQVARIVSSGLEIDQVRTSSLGFGENYNEEILRELTKVSGGVFYDADSPEKLPVILREELEGLQQITAQNVRLRVKPLDFCERWSQLTDYPATAWPDQRTELSIGDLTSEEDRVLVLLLEVLPLPEVQGQPVVSYEGEKLLDLEILWDEIGAQEIKSCREAHGIRVLGTQNPSDVTLNEETVAWIAVQRAGFALDEARKISKSEDWATARAKIQEAILILQRYKLDDKTADGIRVLQEYLQRLENESLSLAEEKLAFYNASYLRKSSSRQAFSAASAPPSFSQKLSIQQQIDQDKQNPPTPPSSNP